MSDDSSLPVPPPPPFGAPTAAAPGTAPLPAPPAFAQPGEAFAPPGEAFAPPGEAFASSGDAPPPPAPPPGGLPSLDSLPPPPPASSLPLPSLSSLPPVVAPAASPVAAPTAAASPKAPRRIRMMDAVCVDVVRRTHDSATLYFFVGDHGGYKTGQFISIDPNQFPELSRWCDYYQKIKGKRESIRAYSMSSIPSEKCVSITVKAEPFNADKDMYPPLLSPFLASGALKGREVKIKGFSGPYTLPDDHREHTTQIVHLVAGSGVVPNYAIVKDEMQKPENASVKHTFIDVNKTWDDIIFREQLFALQEAYPDRLELVHLITREEDPSVHGPNFFKGRPTAELVRRFIDDLDTCLVYSCGPAVTKHEKKKAKAEGYEPSPRFMESVERIIDELGIDHKRFKKEEFG